ncbi:MAG TPA: hypothetical protein VM187_19550, partial [Niastella sp.]|nr:hypothetical protein [Niastella sp.]
MAAIAINFVMCYVEYRSLMARLFAGNKIIITGMLVFLASVLYFMTSYLLKIKQASGAGRLLMLRTGGRHLFDHFLFGIGPGRMNMYYPVWQAQFFETNPAPAQPDFLNASENYLLFNEYLQLFEEVGLAGFACFVALLIDFFRSSSTSKPYLLRCAKATVAAILMCAFTSYPLHVNVVLIIFLTCLTIAYKVRDRPKRKNWLPIPTGMHKPITGSLLCIILFTGFSVIYQSIAAYKWVQLLENPDTPWTMKDRHYQSLSHHLGDYGKFLITSGEHLMQHGGCNKQAAAML